MLAIIGAHDPIVPLQQTYWLHNHVPQIEAPERFTQTVLSWLARHPIVE